MQRSNKSYEQREHIKWFIYFLNQPKVCNVIAQSSLDYYSTTVFAKTMFVFTNYSSLVTYVVCVCIVAGE